MDKNRYEAPEMEITLFETEDIIATSGKFEEGEDDL